MDTTSLTSVVQSVGKFSYATALAKSVRKLAPTPSEVVSVWTSVKLGIVGPSWMIIACLLPGDAEVIGMFEALQQAFSNNVQQRFVRAIHKVAIETFERDDEIGDTEISSCRGNGTRIDHDL